MTRPLAAPLGVADLVRQRARAQPDALAVTDGALQLTHSQLDARVGRLAMALRAAGLAPGERVAVLSENRIEYLELELAAARLGAIVACLNWRLSDGELQHCIRLVSPRLLVVSPRWRATLDRVDHGVPQVVELGDAFEGLRADAVVASEDLGARHHRALADQRALGQAGGAAGVQDQQTILGLGHARRLVRG